MKRTNKENFGLNNPLIDLNKSSSGCASCLDETLKIERQINESPLNEIKIKQIKNIVRSIFQSSKNGIKKN